MKEPSIYESMSILDSDDLTNISYEGLIALIDYITPSRRGHIEAHFVCGQIGKTSKSDYAKKHIAVFKSVIDGIYFPCSRNYLVGCVDLKNDILPDSGSVMLEKSDSAYRWCAIRKRNIEKKNYIMFDNNCDINSYYEVNYILVPFENKMKPFVCQSILAIKNDGYIIPCFSRSEMRRGRSVSAFMGLENEMQYHYGCGAISLLADRKYLWLVDVEENIIDNITSKIQFGVKQDMIKSLLFARQSPLTDLGRKRPILHWVKEHKRRIQEGVDIDIDKYLRGVNEIEMGGLKLKITQPQKKHKT